MSRALLALAAAAVGTYALRAGSVRAFGVRPMSDRVDRVLSHAAVAVMACLAITSLPEPPTEGPVHTVELVALGVTVLTARRTSAGTAMAAGLCSYIAITSVVGIVT